MEANLFLAVKINPDKTLKDIYFKLKKLLAKERVKFYPLNELMLIIRYIGQVPVEFLSDINRLIAPIINTIPKAEITIEGVDIYPYDIMPRVLWFRIKENPILSELAQKLEHSIRDFTGHEEDFAFYPHITFARIRFLRNPAIVEEIKNFSQIEPVTFHVNEITLFEVEKTRSGNQYIVRNRFDLGYRKK